MFGAFSDCSRARLRKRQGDHRHAARRPEYERLEDRCLLSLSPAVSYPAGSAPLALVTEVVTADFNNDGNLDLATGNVYSQVNVLLGNGAGGFAAAHQFAAGNQTLALAAGDLNKDGKVDLVTANYSDAKVNILFGKGDGTFQPAVAKNTSDHPLAVAVADFNADGKLDIVVSEEDPGSWIGVQVLLGNGAGGFTAAQALGVFGPGAGLAVGDLNGDGKLDVVTVCGYGGQGGDVLLGRGDGTFRYASPTYFFTGPDPLGVAIGDFTGDGTPDLIVSAQDVELIRGVGDGTFEYLGGYAANSNAHWGITIDDFNADGKLDAVVSDADTNTISMMLGNGDGTLRFAGAFAAGSTPTGITVGDFNHDGRLDVAVAGYGSGSNTVTVLFNDGNWPTMNSTLSGDYNGNGAVDAADYIVWRKMLGTSVTNFSGADGNGNGVVDQDDQAVWRAHFGETLPAVGAGSLVAAAPAITPELWASVESIEITERASASVESAEPDERGSIEPQGTSARDSALAVLDSWLPQFVPQGKATMRRLHALSTTHSGMKARGNDLLLVRSSAARFDQQPSKRGANSRAIDDSTEEAVETRRQSLDIAFTTLEHAEWQLGGNMWRKVWAGLWFAFALFIGAHAKATPVVIDTNFGPGNAVANANSVHDVLNQQGYAEHAARFFVPMGTNFTFTGIDVPIDDALAANERIESQLSIRLWTNDAGQPGTLLESMDTDVIQVPPGYLIQHVDSTSNSILLQNNYYWISLAAINPGRVGWYTNITETGGYALKWPTSGAAWLVTDTAAAGAFRVFGEAALVPEPTTLYLGTTAAIGMRWRRRHHGVSPARI